jgi:uncharacterized membrane protein
MSINFNCLFIFLQKEGITVDKSEFQFQIQSHPNYPDLLSITDTLNFFNIENGAIHVEASNIEALPNKFITILNNEKKQPQLCFVEKKYENYFYTVNKKSIKIPKEKLEKRWNGVVILVEKSETEIDLKPKKNWFLIFQFVCVVSFFLVIVTFNAPLVFKLFIVFPFLGILLSVEALGHLFKAKIPLLTNFCNMTVSTSCSTVVGSKKWKIFEIVNFSDLSIIFFSFQFVGLLIFLIFDNLTAYFAMQKILLFGAIVVLFLSLYYQKFVEKKWCPICLSINAVVFLELIYLVVFSKNNFLINTTSVVLFIFIFLLPINIWYVIKKLLEKQQKLIEFQLKGTRFIRNYDVFKTLLLATDKKNLEPLSSVKILAGNENANLKITLISNLFCFHCATAHVAIEEMLKKYKDFVCVDFRFNFDANNSNELSIKVHQVLLQIYFEKGFESFVKALGHWFENKDETALLRLVPNKSFDNKIFEILQEQFILNQSNNILTTPEIFINSYQFPRMYQMNELVYFINDLVNDEDFF